MLSKEDIAELHKRTYAARAVMGGCIQDPMWANHAEISKITLKLWRRLLDDWLATHPSLPAVQGLSDEAIRKIALNYCIFEIKDRPHYDILRYEIEEDFFNFCHALLTHANGAATVAEPSDEEKAIEDAPLSESGKRVVANAMARWHLACLLNAWRSGNGLKEAAMAAFEWARENNVKEVLALNKGVVKVQAAQQQAVVRPYSDDEHTLMCAAENLRSVERNSDAAFRLASKLDDMRKHLAAQQQAEPVGDELPQLPSPIREAWGNSNDPLFDVYGAEQMREYGRACQFISPYAVYWRRIQGLLREIDPKWGERGEFGIKPIEQVCMAISDLAAQSGQRAGVAETWERFAAWLVDHCEGQVRTEEFLHAELLKMLATELFPSIRGADIPATMRHDAGAYARCDYCGRYSDNPKSLSSDAWPCDCGKLHGWSGSFKKPTAESQWSAAAPTQQQERSE